MIYHACNGSRGGVDVDGCGASASISSGCMLGAGAARSWTARPPPRCGQAAERDGRDDDASRRRRQRRRRRNSWRRRERHVVVVRTKHVDVRYGTVRYDLALVVTPRQAARRRAHASQDVCRPALHCCCCCCCGGCCLDAVTSWIDE